MLELNKEELNSLREFKTVYQSDLAIYPKKVGVDLVALKTELVNADRDGFYSYILDNF